jgi:hypothetical protein
MMINPLSVVMLGVSWLPDQAALLWSCARAAGSAFEYVFGQVVI